MSINNLSRSASEATLTDPEYEDDLMDEFESGKSNINTSITSVSQKEPKKSTNTNFLKIKYNDNDVGPYKIVIEFLNRDKEVYKINKISVARILKTCGVNDSLIDIKKSSKSQLVAYFDHYEAANRLTTCQNLKLHNLNAYIPLHILSVTGVVSGIPNDLKKEELQDDIDANGLQILKIIRLQREINGTKVNTNRIAITFRSNTLPRHIKMFRVRCPVEMFVPKVILCQSCLRYNHKTENCKGYARCANCGSKQHDEIECRNETYCFYCKQPHKANGNYCKEPQKQRNIRMLMGIRRITYREVNDEYQYFEQCGFDLYNSVHKVPDVYESFNTNQQPELNYEKERVFNYTKTKQAIKPPTITKSKETSEQPSSMPTAKESSEIAAPQIINQVAELPRSVKRRKCEESETINNENQIRNSEEENINNNIESVYQNLLYEVNEILNSDVNDETFKETIKKASLKLESNIKFQLINNKVVEHN